MDPVLYHGIATVGLLALIGLELRSARFRSSTWGDPGRVRRNWSFLVGALVAIALVRVASEALAGALPRLLHWDGAFALEVTACFLVAELLNWLAHWAKHHDPFLWRFHFQHHRESRYSIWLVTHTHPLEVVVTGTLMSAALALLGFSPAAMQAYLLFYSLANTYQHASFDYSLGPLDRLLVNPAYHRVHHAIGKQGNYGSTLTVWDVVFGTAHFPASRVADPALRYGLEPGGGEPLGFREELTWFLEPEASAPPAREPLPILASTSGRLPRA